jgi:hypothetical protein
MACDRFVYWTQVHPTSEQIGQALGDYVGEAGTVGFSIESHRFICRFPGKPSSALKRAEPTLASVCPDDERWFEVFMADDNIDVITRQCDEFTSAVAEGFAALCARVWKGKRDE